MANHNKETIIATAKLFDLMNKIHIECENKTKGVMSSEDKSKLLISIADMNVAKELLLSGEFDLANCLVKSIKT